jgi:uncharacterized protein YneF (UPF0154 family)
MATDSDVRNIEQQLIQYMQQISPANKLEHLKSTLQSNIENIELPGVSNTDEFKEYSDRFITHITTDECCLHSLLNESKTGKQVFRQVQQPNGSIAVCSKIESMPLFDNPTFNKVISQAIAKMNQQGGQKRKEKKIQKIRKIYSDHKSGKKYIMHKKERIFLENLRGKYRYLDAQVRDKIIISL